MHVVREWAGRVRAGSGRGAIIHIHTHIHKHIHMHTHARTHGRLMQRTCTRWSRRALSAELPLWARKVFSMPTAAAAGGG